MPTTVTSTIGTTGRNYSTLQAWEDACPANLVTDDKIWKGECYNDSQFYSSTTSLLTISGITTDATRYVWLTAASGQSFTDHADRRTNLLAYDQSKGVGIKTDTSYAGSPIVNNVHHTLITRLQFYSATNGPCVNSDPYTVHVRDSVFEQRSNRAAVHLSNTGSTFYNVVVFTMATTAYGISNYAGMTCINCTVIQDADVSNVSAVAFHSDSGGILRNCLIVGFSAPTDGTFLGSGSSYNNAWNGASGLPGDNNIYNLSVSVIKQQSRSSIWDGRSVYDKGIDFGGAYESAASSDISGEARVATGKTAIGAWQTARLRNIGTSSRDYSTIQSWEDASPANLVSAALAYRGECYNDSEFTEAVAFTLLQVSGITTSTEYRVELTAAAGHSFQDHASVRTNPMTYDQSKGVGLRKTQNYAAVIDWDVNHIIVSRLQIKSSGNGSGGFTDQGDGIELPGRTLQVAKDCYIEASSNGTVAFGGKPTFINCYAVQKGTSQGLYGHVNLIAINCTVVRPSDVTVASNAFGVNYNATSVVQSCAAFGFTNFVNAEARFDAANCKNNATDLAASITGASGSVHNVPYSQFTPFVDADKDSLDVRPRSGTALEFTGFYNASYPNDISAYPRSVTLPTIGAWELAGPVGTPARLIIEKA